MLDTLPGTMFVRCQKILGRPGADEQETDSCHFVAEVCRKMGVCEGTEIERGDDRQWLRPFRMKIDEVAELAFVSGAICPCRPEILDAALTRTCFARPRRRVLSVGRKRRLRVGRLRCRDVSSIAVHPQFARLHASGVWKRLFGRGWR